MRVLVSHSLPFNDTDHTWLRGSFTILAIRPIFRFLLLNRLQQLVIHNLCCPCSYSFRECMNENWGVNGRLTLNRSSEKIMPPPTPPLPPTPMPPNPHRCYLLTNAKTTHANTTTTTTINCINPFSVSCPPIPTLQPLPPTPPLLLTPLSYLPNPCARAGYDTMSIFLSGV